MSTPTKPSTSVHRALLMSKLLDLHLSRAIAREREKDRVMRKFIQLAENVEADLKELDRDADELERRRVVGKDRAKAVVNTHHLLQDRIDEGIAALEKVADDAGIVRQNTRTAAELAAIEAEEKAELEKLKREPQTTKPGDVGELSKEAIKPEAPKLGEASGGMPEVSFPKAAE
jgi:hypothetical protein